MQKVNLRALGKEEMESFARDLGLPPYRARQLLHWIYEKKASATDEITEFSKDLRARLSEAAYIGGLHLLDTLVSEDGTAKYLFGLEDGLTVESVLIPDADRLTLCVSSQVGCALGCAFCRTGREGLRRNLMAFEIVDQVMAVERAAGAGRITNIVLMGMGEPLMNLDQVVEALWRITRLLGMSKRRITVSTAGVVPKMTDFALRAPEVNLAVSLNASTDQARDAIMPINKRYPISLLIKACRDYPLARRRRITFEYVLIQGINDSPADAGRLVRLLRGIPSKVNLIPLNEPECSALSRPQDHSVLAFQKVLTDAGFTAIIRKSKGADILAACGQLRGQRDEKIGS